MITMIQTIYALVHRYGFWLFAMGAGLILAMMEETVEEPFFSIVAFFYWSFLIFWILRWLFVQIRTTLQQKKDKTNMELLHLQSQVNPHFFFNTLNNLYGLVGKDAKKAQQLILKLSDLMRYSIYEGQKEWVPLREEIGYLENYIELQNSRYHKSTDISFVKNIQQEDILVMPLLFIILLENAFKHGVENLRADAYIHIQLMASEKEIHFGIENNFDPDQSGDHVGIGLKNLHRRLELVYPKRHTLTYIVDGDCYKVQLTLKNL